MKILAVALILAIPVLYPRTPARSVAGSPPMGVATALSFCRTHPAAQERLWLRGWFLPAGTWTTYVEGGLFNSRQALPVTTVDQWNTNGHWRKYSALYVHISTQSVVGPRSLTLHGLLACASYRFWTDRDPLPLPHPAVTYGTTQAGAAGPVTTWAMAGGLKLTLTLPRTVYPRNALAPVAVSIQNLSRHDVGYMTPGVGAPGLTTPQPEVLDHSGRVVFPPAMPYSPAWPGPPPSLAPLHPGQTIKVQGYIVVRGARIRASQAFTPTWSRTRFRPSDTLRTHPITVRLTSEPAPRLTLRSTARGPVVDMTRPTGATGSPLLISLASCSTDEQPFQAAYVPVWTASGLRITPGCSPVRGWNLRVAWPNHPVAALDYTPPQLTPTITPLPTPAPSRTPVPSPTPGPGFDDLLRRAAHATASIHTLHATGRRTSVDSSARMSLNLQADCRSAGGNGIPIMARTLVTGQQSQVGRIDKGYIIVGPVLPVPSSPVHAWDRSPATRGQWRSIDLYRQWRLDRGLSDPIWSPNPAYLNQVCPDLIRRTYLSAPLPWAKRSVLGTQVIDHRPMWHLRERLYFALDLFIDARTFQLRRLVLSDQASASIRWGIRFDYLRINAPMHIPLPRGTMK